jgi:ABC-2 type transport system ATP-binding protein
MTEVPLQAEKFGRRYRRDRPWAVRDVTFQIPDGAIAALVGPNGAGKSTLMRACLGFEEPDEGRVSVFGVDPRHRRAAAVGAIGYIPQGFALYRGLSINDHLTMAQAARPSFDRELALARLAEARLDSGRRVGELSGGEQSQVALAIALATRARLLLFDEPLASLDPLARRDFVSAMTTDARMRAATSVVSSHFIADVEQLCDWLIVLADGQLALAASIAETKSRFGVASGDRLNGQMVVGMFSDPAGNMIALVDGAGGERPATLEEIVLGHMAAARTRRYEGPR